MITLAQGVFIAAFVFFFACIALIFEVIRLRRYMIKQFVTNEQHAALYQQYALTQQQAASMAKQFIDAPKLIAIHRDGRLNVFTFARGDEYFTIETMGLLNDDVDGWRKQAGIKSE